MGLDASNDTGGDMCTTQCPLDGLLNISDEQQTHSSIAFKTWPVIKQQRNIQCITKTAFSINATSPTLGSTFTVILQFLHYTK